MSKVLFCPKKPNISHILSKVLRGIGYDFTEDINDKDITLAVHFDRRDVNQTNREMIEMAEKRNIPIINRYCNNAKKDHVENIFSRVFGYRSFINPKVHRGYCVLKTTKQGVHGGRIIKCPIEGQPKGSYINKNGQMHSFIYQKLINNRCSINAVEDIRALVVGKSIPYVMSRKKPTNETFRFTKEERSEVVKLCDKSDYFTSREVQKIIEFTTAFKVDFADLDILRDNSDGRIYIIDVNNIATTGALSQTTEEEFKLAVKLAIDYFKDYFLK